MKFRASITRAAAGRKSRRSRAFTLAEVLAAMMFMVIVIPVAVQGLRVASRAGEAAERKGRAARIAERILEENLVTTNWAQSVRSGTVTEGVIEFRWSLNNENWSQDSMQQISVEVKYRVQDQECSVRLATLANNQ
jgi:hypothetical protein